MSSTGTDTLSGTPSNTLTLSIWLHPYKIIYPNYTIRCITYIYICTARCYTNHTYTQCVAIAQNRFQKQKVPLSKNSLEFSPIFKYPTTFYLRAMHISYLNKHMYYVHVYMRTWLIH